MRANVKKLVPLLLCIFLVSASAPAALAGGETDGTQPVKRSAKAMSDEELSQVTAGFQQQHQLRSLILGKVWLLTSPIRNLKTRIHRRWPIGHNTR